MMYFAKTLYFDQSTVKYLNAFSTCAFGPLHVSVTGQGNFSRHSCMLVPIIYMAVSNSYCSLTVQ